MPATAPYTPAESYDVLRQLPRPAAAATFLVETFKANLNTHIENATANLEADNQNGLKTFTDFAPMPVNLTDEFVNWLLVGIETNFSVRGHALLDATTIINLHLIDRKLRPREVPQPQYDRALQVVAYLQKFLAGNYDANGNQIWRRLFPLSLGSLPPGEQFAAYSGVLLRYEVLQLTTAQQAGGDPSLYWPAPA